MEIPSKLYRVYQSIWRPVFAPVTSGKNVLSEDWDLLVILDGCRVDVLREVAHEYSFVTDVESVRSVGSQSKEWLAKTFVPEFAREIEDTGYVTANVFTEEVFGESQNQRRTNPANWETVERERLGTITELWRDEWDDELDTVPPRPVTDAAIETIRHTDMSRMIVHYMQPHEPFIAGGEPIHEVWPKVRTGEISEEVAWRQYKNNLKLVLSEVELLLQNAEAPRTILTSDHGNAFGEWGVYGHPIGFQHPAVKQVPWAETTATDSGEYVPHRRQSTRSVDSDVVEERLDALGYR